MQGKVGVNSFHEFVQVEEMIDVTTFYFIILWEKI